MNVAPLPIQVLDGPLADAERAALVFDGAVLVQRGLPAVGELVRLAASIIDEQFGSHDPAGVQTRMDRDTFLAAAAAAQMRFGVDETTRSAFAEALAEAGVDTAAAGWDRRVLRVLPSDGTHAGGRHAVAPVHRDSWGSNLYAQVNWWAPVLPVEAGNTIVFYPAFWRRALPNNSDCWSWEACRAARRVVDGVVSNDHPSAPMPLAALEAREAFPVVIEPGDLLCFSATHLHGGTENRSGRVRFSIETRTLSLHDLRAARGAPNVDGHGTTPRLRWFRHMRDGRPLAEHAPAPPVPPPLAG